MLLPDTKNSVEFFPALLATLKPIVKEITKKPIMETQSINCKAIKISYEK